MVTSGVLLQPDSAARPNFAAFLYGAPFGKVPAIPGHLPPTFLAWAQDDAVARDYVPKFQDALAQAGNAPEIHIFSRGGHGFGLKHQGTTSDHWIDAFYYWLHAQGFK
jgi:acetyl esterase/lipase